MIQNKMKLLNKIFEQIRGDVKKAGGSNLTLKKKTLANAKMVSEVG
jgi:hypothetical protein